MHAWKEKICGHLLRYLLQCVRIRDCMHATYIHGQTALADLARFSHPPAKFNLHADSRVGIRKQKRPLFYFFLWWRAE